jgi:hypothetical protein
MANVKPDQFEAEIRFGAPGLKRLRPFTGQTANGRSIKPTNTLKGKNNERD